MENEKKRGGLKGLADSTKDLYMLNPRIIKIKEGWNVRSDYGNMEELKTSIKENGLRVPLRVYLENGIVYLSDGHRRLKAITELISSGEDIARIPCIGEPKNYNEEQRMFDMFLCNDNKQLEPLEAGILFLRLINTGGYSQIEVANKIGKSQGYVSNCVQLAMAPKKIQDAIKADEIKPNVALDAIRATDNDQQAVEVVTKAIESAKANGAKKASKNDVIAASPSPSKPIPPGRVNWKGAIDSLEDWIEENSMLFAENDKYKAISLVPKLLRGEMTEAEFTKAIRD